MLKRISRRRERLKKILDILEKETRARFETFLVQINCGRATLAQDLKFFVKQGTIKKYEDPEDARVNWYEKVVVGPDDRVKAEKGKYAAIDFIESIENPRYIFKRSKKSKATGSVFVTRVSPYELEGRLKRFEDFAWYKILENLLKSWLKLADKLILPKTPSGGKIAIVLTNES